jgi:Helix-turn-helix domain
MGFHTIDRMFKAALKKPSPIAHIKDTDRAVWFVLGHHADDETGICFPSQPTIAAEAGLCRKAVIEAITFLKECDAISVQKSDKGRKNTYMINIDLLSDTKKAESEEKDDADDSDVHPERLCHEECLHKQGHESFHHPECSNSDFIGIHCAPMTSPDDWCPCGRNPKYDSPAGSYGFCIDCLHEMPMAKIDIEEEEAIDRAAGFPVQ